MTPAHLFPRAAPPSAPSPVCSQPVLSSPVKEVSPDECPETSLLFSTTCVRWCLPWLQLHGCQTNMKLAGRGLFWVEHLRWTTNTICRCWRAELAQITVLTQNYRHRGQAAHLDNAAFVHLSDNHTQYSQEAERLVDRLNDAPHSKQTGSWGPTWMTPRAACSGWPAWLAACA